MEPTPPLLAHQGKHRPVSHCRCGPWRITSRPHHHVSTTTSHSWRSETAPSQLPLPKCNRGSQAEVYQTRREAFLGRTAQGLPARSSQFRPAAVDAAYLPSPLAWSDTRSTRLKLESDYEKVMPALAASGDKQGRKHAAGRRTERRKRACRQEARVGLCSPQPAMTTQHDTPARSIALV